MPDPTQLHELDLGGFRIEIWSNGDVAIDGHRAYTVMNHEEVARMIAFLLEHNPPTADSTNVMVVGYWTSLELQCPYCKKVNVWPIESQEARGVFAPYCPGGDCEDLHAATL